MSGPATADALPTISVCVSCRAGESRAADTDAKPGEILLAGLLARIAERREPVAVRAVQCLSVCKRPCTVAFSAPARYTYVFGDLDPTRDVDDLLACASLYGRQEHGYLLWRERPEVLRRGVVARLPPLDWSPPDGSHPR